MKALFAILFLFLSIQLCTAQHQTTKGVEFWFTYMENLDLAFNGPPSFAVVISSEVATSGQIQVPFTGLNIPFTVNAMSDTEVFLPAGVLYPQGDESVIHFGLKVVTVDSVNVYAYHYRNYFTEASLILPVSELSSHCMITAQVDDRGLQPCELVVEATQDSTDIEIVPSQVTVSFRPPGVPFYKTLNKGDVFQLQSYYNLAGTTITSLNASNKIAVFSGTRQSALRCNAADDHLYDQNYMHMFGQEFVVVPMYNQGGDILNIVTRYDSNYVRINNGTPFLLADAGQFIDTMINTASFISSTKPICISQYKKSNNCSLLGDPCMVIIPPINYLKTRAIFKNDSAPPSATSAWMTDYYVNIVTYTGAQVLLDGNPVSGFQMLTANPMYSWKQLQLTYGSHNLYCQSGFNAFSYGVGFANAYAYHLGFDYNTAPVMAIASSDTVFCDKQSIDFFDVSTNNATSWQWTFTGAVPNTSTSQNPTGIYYPISGTFDVQLIACNATSCDTLLLPNFITEYNAPAMPLVTGSGGVLYSTVASTYAWYSTTNPTLILSVDSFYIPQVAGSYYVITTDSNGCQASSNVFVITALELTPYNPFIVDVINDIDAGMVHIKVHQMLNESLRISLCDVTGKEWLRIPVNGVTDTIQQINVDVSMLAAGVYFVTVENSDHKMTSKIVVK